MFEALGNVWLSSIEPEGWRAVGGVRVAQIGPLMVKSGREHVGHYGQKPGRHGTSPTSICGAGTNVGTGRAGFRGASWNEGFPGRPTQTFQPAPWAYSR